MTTADQCNFPPKIPYFPQDQNTLSVKRNLSLLQSDTKIHHIKMNHIWTLISHSNPYEAYPKNQRVAFVKKEKNVVKSQEVIFVFKSQNLLTENLHEKNIQ